MHGALDTVRREALRRGTSILLMATGVGGVTGVSPSPAAEAAGDANSATDAQAAVDVWDCVHERLGDRDADPARGDDVRAALWDEFSSLHRGYGYPLILVELQEGVWQRSVFSAHSCSERLYWSCRGAVTFPTGEDLGEGACAIAPLGAYSSSVASHGELATCGVGRWLWSVGEHYVWDSQQTSSTLDDVPLQTLAPEGGDVLLDELGEWAITLDDLGYRVWQVGLFTTVVSVDVALRLRGRDEALLVFTDSSSSQIGTYRSRSWLVADEHGMWSSERTAAMMSEVHEWTCAEFERLGPPSWDLFRPLLPQVPPSL